MSDTECYDYTIDTVHTDGDVWYDHVGRTCLYYETVNDTCSNIIAEYPSSSINASTICCTCGGGSNDEILTTDS